MKKIFSLFVSMSLVSVIWLAPQAVIADVISPGYHDVGTCYDVSNKEGFLEYTFVLVGTGAIPSTAVIKDGECAGVYKFSDAFLIAVKNEDLEKVLADDFVVRASGDVMTKEEVGAGDIFADVDFSVPRTSEALARAESSLPNANPLRTRTYFYKVEDIEGTTVTVVPDKVTYIYADGSTETLNASDTAFPEPSQGFSWKQFMGTWQGIVLAAVVFVAALALLFIILRRKKNRGVN